MWFTYIFVCIPNIKQYLRHFSWCDFAAHIQLMAEDSSRSYERVWRSNTKPASGLRAQPCHISIVLCDRNCSQLRNTIENCVRNTNSRISYSHLVNKLSESTRVPKPSLPQLCIFGLNHEFISGWIRRIRDSLREHRWRSESIRWQKCCFRTSLMRKRQWKQRRVHEPFYRVCLRATGFSGPWIKTHSLFDEK